ncbi:MAG: Fic/DOC family N-terminal domain-containing protein [Gemmatimonadales bacterium]|nr:Fic/DOC family N-terminal domain-containing protein [Gemmatimonadales bacterium]
MGTLSAADRALGRLGGIARGLPNPRLLVGPFSSREAVLSSRIEGTQASLTDLALHEAAPAVAPKEPDVREVANYLEALTYATDPGRRLPLSMRLLRELHRILLTGVRGRTQTPGEFRTVQNYIGRLGASEDIATFIPPPVPQMNEGLGALEKYLHRKSDLPPLVRLALIHYQFEAIHPFLDGNGRVGRLLVTLVLHEEKLLDQPLLYLSAFFEMHRAQYYELLLAVSQHGEFEQWIRFFLEGVRTQSEDAVRRADRLHALREDYQARLKKTKAPPLQYRIVDLLFEHIVVSASTVVNELDVTHRAAMMSLRALAALKLVTEPVKRKRYRVFWAKEIDRILGSDVA